MVEEWIETNKTVYIKAESINLSVKELTMPEQIGINKYML